MRHYYFVYRTPNLERLDLRCPVGGIVVTGWTAKGLLQAVWDKADARYPCKPGEILCIREVKDDADRKHAVMMDRDWERSFAAFQQWMTVS